MEKNSIISLINFKKKSIAALFISWFFAYLFNQSYIFALGLVFAIFVISIVSNFSNFFFANIFMLLTIFSIFSADSFILKLANEVNIYASIQIWKFTIFEYWVFSLLLIFLIHNLFYSNLTKETRLSLGPLKPLLLFALGGIIFGIIGTIRNKGDISLGQIRSYYEGLTLYFIALNIDFRQINIKPYFYFIICLVSLNSLYHLILYFIGKAFIFGTIGAITMGYGDILQNIVLVTLFIFSSLMLTQKNMGRWITKMAWVLLLMNSATILLSLRRSYIALYLLGLVIILFFSNGKNRVRFLIIVSLFILFISTALLLTNNTKYLHKVGKRIESVNIFKYRDDAGEGIASSSGHVSEFVNGWRNVKNNILVGTGFNIEIKKFQGWKYNYMMVHNELFFYWIRMGVFGMLMFFSMYLIPIFYCIKKIGTDYFNKWIYVTVLGFLVGKFLLGAIFYPPISDCITKSYIYFILLGLVMNNTLLIKNR